MSLSGNLKAVSLSGSFRAAATRYTKSGRNLWPNTQFARSSKRFVAAVGRSRAESWLFMPRAGRRALDDCVGIAERSRDWARRCNGRLSLLTHEIVGLPGREGGRRIVGLPSLPLWNWAKALGSGPKLAATPADLPSGTSVAV